jgi:D-arabinose 1-dehydrogenase-like Zn-dependent alcohol dehydrogenase
MCDELADYRKANAPLPEKFRLWPLYGAGFENLGRDGKMIEVPLPEYGPDELLVRHDAVGICFSDIKVIRSGQNHPRIYRDMSEEPVVLGHEVILTVVGIGENLRDQYKIGDRFIVQADIYVDGVGWAYGYEIQGGFSQYNRIDQRVLNGDGGNYLLPVKETTGYAEAALNEPWACVEASYIVQYRTAWKEGGALWIVGNGAGATLGRAMNWRPAQVVVDVADAEFAELVRTWAAKNGVELLEDDGQRQYDDVVVLDNDPELIEQTFARLAKGGLFNVVTEQDVPRRVQLDIGRMHYDDLGAVGTTHNDVSSAYQPIRTQLKPGGVTWILGAGGPMGHMHLQRALEIEAHPRKVVATNLHLHRIEAVRLKFAPTAQTNDVELVYHSQETFGSAESLMVQLRLETGGDGFDDIAVMAPSVPAIEMAMDMMADNGVMNVFAGLPRGTMASFDMNDIVQRGIRFTGTSGSSIEDLAYMLNLTESHALVTNRSVTAVAGLEGVPDGLRAVAAGRFPGKVVVWPNLNKPLGLTTLEELENVLPTVFAKLDENGEWTIEAEEEFLCQML